MSPDDIMARCGGKWAWRARGGCGRDSLQQAHEHQWTKRESAAPDTCRKAHGGARALEPPPRDETPVPSPMPAATQPFCGAVRDSVSSRTLIKVRVRVRKGLV
ncbi:hypothetical protein M8818_002655 [Zalaria obscura]|uniref:Uncharacterized protein n=1 Tax=Zalaria obscura TaxID=2024903 RepID=A0ACC3SII7_9PEZI